MNRYRQDPNAPSHLRRLVESARGDGLDAERRRQVAERLGIAPRPRTPVEPERGPVKSSKSWLSVGTITVTAVAVIGGAAGLVGSRSTTRTTSTSVDPTVATMAATVAVTPVSTTISTSMAALSAPAEVSVTSMNVAALPDVRADDGAKPSRAPASPARSPEPTTEASDLRREIAALDGVRQATESGAPREALRRLDEYARSFPVGKLREEALVLRIEALDASGDHAAAERLAQRLFRESPNTPYAARVRAALVSPSRE